MKKYFKMLWKVLLYFIIYYLSQIICSFFSAIILGKIYKVTSIDKLNELMNKNLYMVLIPAAIIALLIYNFMFIGKEVSLKQRCSFKRLEGSIKKDVIFLGLSIGAFSTSLIYFTQNIFKDYANVSKTFSDSLTSLPGIITLIVIVPIVEEILFRGLIFNELRANLNIVVSLILQALLFALAHGNMLQGIYTFMVGMIAGLIYIWTKSIISNMILHVTFNLAGTFIFPILIYYSQGFAVVYMILGLTFTSIFIARLFKNKVSQVYIKPFEQNI